MKEIAKAIGFVGSVSALIISYGNNGSILWAIAHAFLGWIYVIYHVVYN
jgi:hypothetical protein